MIKAVVFDMDGLLIDSEPIWQQAEREVFGELGIYPQAADFEKTMGVRIDEVVARWYARKPWVGPSQEAIAERIVDRVAELVTERGNPKPGAAELVDYFCQKELCLSVASSSLYRVIDAVMAKLGLREVMDVIHSAEDEKCGKPAPDVYLGACRKLGISPTYCLAFEDSPNGVCSAKAAGLLCVFVPDSAIHDRSVSTIADLSIDSLLHFGDKEFLQMCASITPRAQ